MGNEVVQRMCPIGLDEHPTICSAGSCDVCVGNRIRWLEEDRQRLARNCQHNLDGKREQEARKKEAISLLHEKDARIAALTEELERVKSELEDARIYITTEDGAKLHIRNLIRCGLRSLRRKRGVFWGSVADAYGVGSTSAHRLCRFVNLNPDTGELEPT